MCIRDRCTEELVRQEQIIGLSMDLSGYDKTDFINSYVSLPVQIAPGRDRERRFYEKALEIAEPVSYTHLDVYKRQE